MTRRLVKIRGLSNRPTDATRAASQTRLPLRAFHHEMVPRLYGVANPGGEKRPLTAT